MYSNLTHKTKKKLSNEIYCHNLFIQNKLLVSYKINTARSSNSVVYVYTNSEFLKIENHSLPP